MFMNSDCALLRPSDRRAVLCDFSTRSFALRQRENKHGRAAGPARCFGPRRRHPANENRSESRRDGDVLAPPDRIAYWPAAMTRTGVEGPELLARLCIVSQEVPFNIASEQNVTA